jgi:hypothetical protein
MAKPSAAAVEQIAYAASAEREKMATGPRPWDVPSRSDSAN